METSLFKRIAPFAVLVLVCIASLFTPTLANFKGGSVYNGADIT
jgi:hypothetical protein